MLWSTVKILLLWWFWGVSSHWSWYPRLLGNVSPWKSLSALQKERNHKGLSPANKVQRGDFFQDQELFHAEGCVGRCIVVMQNPSFSCPESSLFLMNFVDKMSQNFLVLVNCLPLMNKLMMHHFLMVKEDDQHHFHLWNIACGLSLDWARTHFSTDDSAVLFSNHIERPMTHLLWWRFLRVFRLLPSAEGCLCMHSIVEFSAPQSRALAPFWYTPSACPKCQLK